MVPSFNKSSILYRFIILNRNYHNHFYIQVFVGDLVLIFINVFAVNENEVGLHIEGSSIFSFSRFLQMDQRLLPNILITHFHTPLSPKCIGVS